MPSEKFLPVFNFILDRLFIVSLHGIDSLFLFRGSKWANLQV